MHFPTLKCRNVNKRSLLTALGWGCGSLLAGMHQVTIVHLVNLKGTDVLCYYIFWQTSATPITTNSQSHRIAFIMKIVLGEEDKCSPQNIITWAQRSLQKPGFGKAVTRLHEVLPWQASKAASNPPTWKCQSCSSVSAGLCIETTAAMDCGREENKRSYSLD